MFCLTCNQDRSPLRIGTGDYCAVCGSRVSAEVDKHQPAPSSAALKPAAAPVRRSMDMGPARRPAPTVSARLSPKTVVSPASPGRLMNDVAPRRAVQGADALHRGPASSSRGALAVRPTPLVSEEPIQPQSGVNTLEGQIHRERAPQASVKAVTLQTAIHHAPAPQASQKSIQSAYKGASFLQSHASGVNERMQQAKTVERSGGISKFTHMSTGATPASSGHTDMPAAAVTHHESLGRLIGQMPTSHMPSAHGGSSRTSRLGAVAGVVLVLGGYIWLQNSPKLAIRSAGSQAGLAVTLPSYLPSSYHLADTQTAPGLVTLNFAAPSGDHVMKILQERTDWDTGSLLDNMVAKASTDYSAIQGQGLTIYLYNKNQAAWINRGIRYSIVNSGRLSREEILKIAYSL